MKRKMGMNGLGDRDGATGLGGFTNASPLPRAIEESGLAGRL
jgi:hypothetical protein